MPRNRSLHSQASAPTARGRLARVVLTPLLALAMAGSALAQGEVRIPDNLPTPKDAELERGAWTKLNAMGDSIMATMMQQNGWNSDADKYVIRMHEELKRVPSFELQKRLDVVLKSATQRYDLSDEQQTKLRALILRESVGFMIRNNQQIRAMLGQIKQDRLWEQKMSPELVSQYVQMYRPMFDSGSEAMMRATEEFGNVLTPEQRKLFEQDVVVLNDRFSVMREQMTKWEAGDWQPEEWGLKPTGGIPDYSEANRELVSILRQPTRPAEATLRENQADDDDDGRPGVSGTNLRDRQSSNQPSRGGMSAQPLSAWAKFVEDYIKANNFDEAQATAARSLATEFVERAQRLEKSIKPKRDALQAQLAKAKTPEEKADIQKRLDTVEKPLSGLFYMLFDRLQALRTTDQKRSAMEDGKPAPKADEKK